MRLPIPPPRQGSGILESASHSVKEKTVEIGAAPAQSPGAQAARRARRGDSVGAREVIDCEIQFSEVQCRDSQVVIVFGKLRRCRANTEPLIAEPQMNAGALRNLRGRPAGESFKNLLCFLVVLPLEMPCGQLKVLDGGLRPREALLLRKVSSTP